MEVTNINPEIKPAKESGSPVLPVIKNYRDYRKFLKDFYEYKKNLRSGFSFRKFSALCGFKSPNYLQLVMKGERNLSEIMAESVAQAVGLKVYEKDYFVSLIRQENSKTDEELRRAEKESLIAIKKMVSKQIPDAQNQVFSEWYHLLVRELLMFKDFEPTGEYISEHLGGAISIKQAEESWALLYKAGFVTQLESGRWTTKDPVLDSGDGAFSGLLINKYHSDNMKFWQSLLNEKPSTFHELGLLNIPMSKSKIPELKKRIQQFQDEIIGWLQDEKNPDSLVQLGTYMFKVR